MYSTTGLADSCDLMRSMTSTAQYLVQMNSTGALPALRGPLADGTLLLDAHARPAAISSIVRPQPMQTLLRIERADLDAG